MSNNKKYTAVIVLAFAIVATAIFYFRPSSELAPTQVEQTATTTDWLTYHDSRYHFRIDYPRDLFVFTEEGEVAFTEGEGGIGIIAVTIEPTPYKTPDEVILSTQPNSNIVVEGHTVISGYPALIRYNTVEGFDRPFPKDILLVKDGNLFTISDRSVDYQRTWQSFHFEE